MMIFHQISGFKSYMEDKNLIIKKIYKRSCHFYYHLYNIGHDGRGGPLIMEKDNSVYFKTSTSIKAGLEMLASKKVTENQI